MEQSLSFNIRLIKEGAEQCVLYATICVKKGRTYIHNCSHMLETSPQDTFKVGNTGCLKERIRILLLYLLNCEIVWECVV